MPGRFDKAAERITQQQEFKEEQQRLHKKYDEPENVVIKETSNTFKFTVKTVKGLIKTICGILLIAFAATGMLAVLYPSTRTELMEVFNGIWQDVLSMI